MAPLASPKGRRTSTDPASSGSPNKNEAPSTFPAAKTINWIQNHPVTTISGAVAACTMVLVPPDATYANYFDWRTLSCLFCILGIVAALRHNGFFDILCRYLLCGFKTSRQLMVTLTMVTGFISMFITNDLALILMLPLTMLLLTSAQRTDLLPLAFILQTLSANLLGMIMPFGNPQNLYLFSHFEIPADQFMATMALPFFLSTAALLACCIALVKPQPIAASLHTLQDTHGEGADPDPHPAQHSNTQHKTQLLSPAAKNTIYGLLFLLALAAVFRLLPFQIPVLAIALALGALDRKALKDVDWMLLLTFLFFFIFSGNLSRIPQVHAFAAQLLQINTLITSALASQVISNVPAAVLLAQFTTNWPALLVGVNIGGAGTIVASLASLITLSHYRQARISNPQLPSAGHYLLRFSVFNVAFLMALLVICSAVGIR